MPLPPVPEFASLPLSSVMLNQCSVCKALTMPNDFPAHVQWHTTLNLDLATLGSEIEKLKAAVEPAKVLLKAMGA